jgi:UDP-N-acetylglucosamine transferase subunit ALG13
MSTLVTVGNATQPFSRLLAAVERALPILPRPVVVQCGHTPFNSSACRVEPFLSLEAFSKHIAASSLVIAHAGAGTIISTLAHGRMPIVIPRLIRYGEHVDDHQLEFASEMARLGKVVLVSDLAELEAVIRRNMAGASTAVHISQPPRLHALVAGAINRRSVAR